jgi:hypothetical protein
VSATTLYRIAAVVFVLFAAGHTVGFLSLKPPTPEASAVWYGMNHVRFAVDGSSFSYGEFYRGFGLSCTVSMLFSALLAWELGRMARTYPKAVGSIGWALCLVQVAGLVLAVLYFSVAPAAFSGVAALLLAVAAWQAGRAAVN